jgi:hypothetical protein
VFVAPVGLIESLGTGFAGLMIMPGVQVIRHLTGCQLMLTRAVVVPGMWIGGQRFLTGAATPSKVQSEGEYGGRQGRQLQPFHSCFHNISTPEFRRKKHRVILCRGGACDQTILVDDGEVAARRMLTEQQRSYEAACGG